MLGIFDSGLGGLTVLKEIQKILPDRNYIYLGDNARAPYGGRSPETIYGYAKDAVDFLFAKDCKLIIFACNTASAQALRRIQQEYLPSRYPNCNVLGVIRPLAEAAAKSKDAKRIGVIGTRATIESRAYEIELKKINPQLEVFQNSAPLLVPLIEEGWAKTAEAKKILKKYLLPLKQKQVQILIPACTHYPILDKEIRQIMTSRCQVLDSGAIVAQSLQGYLNRHPEYESTASAAPSTQFFTTDNPGRFRALAKKFLDIEIRQVEKAFLGIKS